MNSSPDRRKTYLFLLVFAIAMGLLEAIVAVYLRKLFYPGGFSLPVRLMSFDLTVAELVREICTLVMIVAIAFLAGKSAIQRLSVFLFSFAVWDIFYYIGLKLFLDWPSSWFTWDILFLIPVVWLGPVIAPVICSVAMIFLAVLYELLYQLKRFKWFNFYEMVLLAAGSILICISFTIDIGMLIIKGGYLHGLLSKEGSQEFNKVLSAYIPVHFHWEIFIPGMVLILASAIMVYRRSRQFR
jgi:hypothetical protein